MGSGSVAAAARVEPSRRGSPKRTPLQEWRSWNDFFYARAVCIEGNTFYVSRERFVSPPSRPPAVATKCRHCQRLAVGSFKSKADLLRPAVV